MNLKEENRASAIIAKVRWILPFTLWSILSICSYTFLLKVEERSFFQFDLFWFNEFLKTPAGILSWCSLLLTHFLYIPWLGALIWVLLLTLSAELTRIIFKITSNLSLLAYIPATIFIAYNMSMGYMVYLMNSPGYFFLPVLGYLWALMTIFIFRKINKPYASLVFTVIWGMAGYYFAGFYGLAGLFAAGTDMIFSGRIQRAHVLPLVGIATTIILAPILFWGATTYYLPKGWTIGLPDHIHSVPLSRMQLPIIIAFLFLTISPLYQLFEKKATKNILIVQSITLAAIIAIPAITWYKDSNFKAELKMIQAADNLDWEKIPKIFNKISDKSEKDPSWQPTRVMVVLKDLALIKTGQEGNLAFSFEDGSRPQKTKWDIPMSAQIGWIVGLHYGIPGYCQRLCYEENMLFGWNNMTFKYNTMIAMLFENTGLIEKYLDILDKTIFYRKWAKEQRHLLNNHDLISKTRPYNLILPLMCYDDNVCSDKEGCEMFLKRHFNGVVPQKSTPLYDKVALFFAMKSKDETLFWTRFFLYLESNNPSKIDRFYQEAAYLYAQSNNSLLQILPFDDQVKDLYKSFSSSSEKYGSKSLDEAKILFTKNLRHTYYYYTYYVNYVRYF